MRRTCQNAVFYCQYDAGIQCIDIADKMIADIQTGRNQGFLHNSNEPSLISMHQVETGNNGIS